MRQEVEINGVVYSIHELDTSVERMLRVLRNFELCSNKQMGYDIVRFVNSYIEGKHE